MPPHVQQMNRPAGPANPFESYLLVVCVIQGAAVVFGWTRPPSIEYLLPTWLRFIWGLLLLLGGVAAFAGLYWPWDQVDGILIKRIGLWAAGGGTLAYGIALLSVVPSGFLAAALNLGFAAACFTRAWQVTKRLVEYRAQLAMIRHLAATSSATSPEEPCPPEVE